MNMDPSEGKLVLERVAARLDGAGIAWAVFAGTASVVYGASHPLTDIDILVPAAEAERVADLFHGSPMLALPDLDLIAGLGLMDLDAQMAARIRRYEVCGILVPIIPPEDNILLKAMWGRGPEVGKHDWEDVEAMMAYLPQIDWQYLHQRAGIFPDKAGTERAVARVEAIWRRLDKPPVQYDPAYGTEPCRG
jgi:hypothetical protein